MEQDPAFTPELFAFARDLAANNDREWFKANRHRYDAAVKEPALAFIEDVEVRMPQEVSPHFSGSLFRIHRDTRFAKDKSPYKTHVGIYFKHVQGRDVHSPIHYLHLEPGNVFLGVGLWRPETPTLRRLRDAIVARPDAWRAAVAEPAFAERFEPAGESLKRPPQGYPADHPLVEDLKRKDFVAIAQLSEAAVVSPAFLDDVLGLCARAAPYMRWLCGAVGVPY